MTCCLVDWPVNGGERRTRTPTDFSVYWFSGPGVHLAHFTLQMAEDGGIDPHAISRTIPLAPGDGASPFHLPNGAGPRCCPWHVLRRPLYRRLNALEFTSGKWRGWEDSNFQGRFWRPLVCQLTDTLTDWRSRRVTLPLLQIDNLTCWLLHYGTKLVRSGRFALPRPEGHKALDLACLLFHHERKWSGIGVTLPCLLVGSQSRYYYANPAKWSGQRVTLPRLRVGNPGFYF